MAGEPERLMKFDKIYLLLASAIGIAWLLSLAYMQASIMPANIVHTVDYRKLGAIWLVKLNVTWNGEPLANVSLTILDSQLNRISENRTGESGLCTYRSTVNGSYYLMVEYWAYFRQGGVEIFRKWFIVTLGTSEKESSSLTIPLQLSPEQWPLEPDVKIGG